MSKRATGQLGVKIRVRHVFDCGDCGAPTEQHHEQEGEHPSSRLGAVVCDP
ncbi:MAG TPA: hypothetical protein VGR30_04585 [Candidatus Binatia bacterium]|nr:hypothetical protein [Candidatus Binatia bacterium]